MNTIIHRPCPVCNIDNIKTCQSKYSRDEWLIKNCSQCRFVYLENAPVYEALINDFAWEKTSQQEKQDRKSREPLKHVISHYLKTIRRKYLKRNKLPRLIKQHFSAGNVMDIGCAAAGILSRLDDKHTPFGVEISEYLAKKGNTVIQTRGGCIIHDNALSGMGKFEDNFFNGIIMSAFLEHEINPVELLQECYRTLNDGGKVIIKVPNYNCINRMVRGSRWCGFRFPDHVNYFTPASLRMICKKIGFKIQQFGLSDRQSFNDNMWMVIVKN